jgi:hypothetical protein
MRENRPPGSVEGVRSNRDPYSGFLVVSIPIEFSTRVIRTEAWEMNNWTMVSSVLWYRLSCQ